MTGDDERRSSAAETLAAELSREARARASRAERRQRRRIAALVEDAASRALLLELTDQVLRIRTPRRAAARLADLVETFRSPAMAGPLDRAALSLAGRLARIAPQAVVTLATARLRRELATLVLPADARRLGRHLRERSAEGMRLNVNLLGEAVQGEGQAQERSRLVVELLGRPDVECVSVKLSALDSQLDVLAYDESLERVRERLRPVLEAATAHAPAKLVYLDMEEYRDLHLTVDAFTSLLDAPPFTRTVAGIALQAYLPDSAQVLSDICAFARRRYARTGAPVRVRLVKGANLAMERVDAELHGWTQAPFMTKAEVDANYKRLLDLALAPENAGALMLGVASHNLFDVAWALVRDDEAGGGRLEIEMLEGMATSEAEAVSRRAGGILLYAPVVRRGEFESAVAYLVRRFDENTASENFLAHQASLAPGSATWDEERRRFRAAVADRHRPAGPPRRATPPERPRGAITPSVSFANTPDTDFTQADRRAAVTGALADVVHAPPGPVPALVDGCTVGEPLTGAGIDPSHPERPWYRYTEADLPTVERAVAVARQAATGWAATPPERRRELLHAVADVMEAQRARTTAIMVADAGKVVREADPEISEAVDGARYYGDRATALAHHHDGADFRPYGVVVVAPPWNFPYAIPSGGVCAALAAGNAVILKPAPETVLTAATIVAQCHAAGIPAGVLQFLPCADGDAGRRLVTHPQVDAVVLTGAWDTARRFLSWRPGLALHAETSGKNAIVVTAAADLEDAVRDLVHSAFSHAGQKCSAASLAILEAPVHDDRRFLSRLADAVASLRVGPAEDPTTAVGPLIRPPGELLERALTTLAPGERWLVQPSQVGASPHLWSPGVKLGVAPMSELHLSECFGPVLGVMRARDLEHALELQNAVQFGLTAGISTLDDREVARWTERVQAGNVYVNRHTTGAVIRRQPFGGWKRSSVGPGAKAGGPNYVASMGRWQVRGEPDVPVALARARQAAARLLPGEDPSGLVAERNLFRVRPLRRAALRLGTAPDRAALEVSLAVASDLGVAVEVSSSESFPGLPTNATVEDEGVFAKRIAADPPDRVRLVGAPGALRLELMDAGTEVDVEPLVASGTYELCRWTHEQAVSITMHRHGLIASPGPPSPPTPAGAPPAPAATGERSPQPR